MSINEERAVVPSLHFRNPVTNSLWLISILAVSLAIATRAVRFDLQNTRAALGHEVQYEKSTWPSGLNPHLSPVLLYIVNTEATQYSGNWQWSKPSDTLTETIRLLGAQETEKLIPRKQKLWDLLNELFLVGPESAIDFSLKSFAESIYLSQSINRSGLCDYIDRRIMPGIKTLVERRDYGGARQLVLRMNSWITALRSTPELAYEHPRLQSYVNFFLRLDALLNDPVTLLSRPIESKLILTSLLDGGLIEPAAANYLKNTDVGELIAWGGYLSGQALLSNKQAKEAVLAFRTARQNTANPLLTDLMFLGEARSMFWKAKIDSKEVKVTVGNLHDLRNSVRAQFRDDIDYYITNLRKI
jgi:hypothetical protein